MSAVEFPGVVTIRVLVVDSSRITSQAISAALESDGVQVFYAGPKVNDVLTTAERERVNVALVSEDLGTQEASGYELAERLRAVLPRVQVIIVLDHTDRDSTISAFRTGARGIFCRSSSLEVLRKCISRVHEGQVWASSTDVENLIAGLRMPLRLVNATGVDLLSKRERDVVQWAAEGFTNREIANRLGLSENTVKNYLFHIFDKLGISSRVELVLYAVNQLMNIPQNSGKDPCHAFDDETAMFQWCRKAAERFIVAQYAVGEMYRDGRGVPRDTETAYMWFCIAESLSTGIEYSTRDAKRRLERKLQPEQVAVAKRRASEWLEQQTQFSLSTSRLRALVPRSDRSQGCSRRHARAG
jgi:DNA-binding NarL/FixJ family response regulator